MTERQLVEQFESLTPGRAGRSSGRIGWKRPGPGRDRVSRCDGYRPVAPKAFLQIWGVNGPLGRT